MAAANTDKLMKVGTPGTATTLSSPGYTSGNTSITVASTTNWPTDTGVVFAIDRAEVNADGDTVRVDGTYCEFVGTVSSATSITNVSKVYGTAQDYSAGSLTRVYIPVSSERENRIVDWGTAEHDQDGTHKSEIITSRTAETTTATDDVAMVYDTSATALRKVTLANLTPDSTITTAKIADDAVTAVKRSQVIKGGTFTVTATGAKAITGVGFTPKAIMFTWLPGSGFGIAFNFGYGFTDGTTQWAFAANSQEGGDHSGGSVTNKCILATIGNQAVSVNGSLTSFDADGFTLDITTYVADRVFGYICYA